MTDNEIIKALKSEADYNCDMCCDNNENCMEDDCGKIISENALDLINRQKAEIDKLKSRNNFLEIEYKNQSNLFWERVEGAKSEAIREFAERLKKEVNMISYGTGFEYNDIITTIDDLVKEMTED